MFKLKRVLPGHPGGGRSVAWSPDGKALASGGVDRTVKVWNPENREPLRKIKRPESSIWSVAWSPVGHMIAAAFEDVTIRIWDSRTGHFLFSIDTKSGPANCLGWSPTSPFLAFGTWDGIELWDVQHGLQIWSSRYLAVTAGVNGLAWAADGKKIASGGDDQSIVYWDAETGNCLQKIAAHDGAINDVEWSSDGTILASGSDDATVRIWSGARELSRLEAHTSRITAVSFSFDGALLATKGEDGAIFLWRTNDWRRIGRLNERKSVNPSVSGIAFHPREYTIATLSEEDTLIKIWEVSVKGLGAVAPSVYYTNAKIVLMGDTGVGKSGLSLVLSGQNWTETGSTHARKVWTFSRKEIALPESRKETREALLWDLAGQQNYRIIHQLQLNEVTVALIVFDSRSTTDPFVGVKHWDRALRLSQRAQGNNVPITKFLVAARIDVGRIGVSRSRIDALIKDLGFDGYFETSAKQGWGIGELVEELHHCIRWENLPRVSSTKLFRQIKDFIVSEKKQGRLLSTSDDLFRLFTQSQISASKDTDLRAQFDTCIRLVESRGLIRRLSFGGLILLQPEKIDSYASAIADAAKDEPDGMGSIAEEVVLEGKFQMPLEEKLERDKENLLLPATVAHLLRHEIALREQTDQGPVLVFPSQLTREFPELPDSEGKTIILTFEGAALNVYATLVVRLSHSGFFSKQDMWKNAASFAAKVGGICGISLRELEEGRGELTLFFDNISSEETRFQFEEYIIGHLQRRALPNTIVRRRIFVCNNCHTPVSDLAAQRRLDRKVDWLVCPVCEKRISLLDREKRLTQPVQPIENEMDRAANSQRERDIAVAVLPGKEVVRDFDVFLCHNSSDKDTVREVGTKLREYGILPWLDEWELRPGLPWQRAIEEQIGNLRSAVVFVGPAGIGPWHRQEMEAILREFANRGFPVIPVLLPGAPTATPLPVFLKGITWVDLGKPTPDPYRQLIWGITGSKGPSEEKLNRAR